MLRFCIDVVLYVGWHLDGCFNGIVGNAKVQSFFLSVHSCACCFLGGLLVCSVIVRLMLFGEGVCVFGGSGISVFCYYVWFGTLRHLDTTWRERVGWVLCCTVHVVDKCWGIVLFPFIVLIVCRYLRSK